MNIMNAVYLLPSVNKLYNDDAKCFPFTQIWPLVQSFP